MNSPVQGHAKFTAAQIAAHAGLTKRRVLQLMAAAGIEPDAAVIVRGQAADAWFADSLPPAIASRLDAVVARRRFRDRESLLQSQCFPFAPARPWEQIAERDKVYAERLKLALESSLARMNDLSVSDADFIAHGVRDFEAAFAGAPPELGLPRTISPRHWRRLWERTLARDAGRDDWSRSEIYLPERLSGQRAPMPGAGHLFADLKQFVDAATRAEPGKDKDEAVARMWHAGFTRMETLVDEGHGEKKMRRALIEFLFAHAPFLASSSDSLRVQCLQKLARWREGGRTWEALMDGRHENAGRESTWAFVLKDEAVRNELRTLYAATMGAASQATTRDRHTGSMALALARFADSELCPPGLVWKLRKGSQPACFLRFLRTITPEQEAMLRSSKAYDQHGPVGSRDDTIKGPDGKRYKLPATALWEADDMSVNQPFFAEDGAGNVILSRQGLYVYAPLCRRWLAVDLIARPREAYRAEDVLRFFRRVFELYGKPRILRLEKGVFAARIIRGGRVTDDGFIEEKWERPAMPPEDLARVQDGLAAIGVIVQYVSKAKGKGAIEGRFNHLQDVVATFTNDFVNIGRHPGEFEHSAKQLRRVRAGSHHPADLGFAPMPVMADRIWDAMDWINRDERNGAAPYKLWDRDKEDLKPLTQSDLAAFLPSYKPDLKIRGLRVSVTVDKVAHHFRAPELFASLGDGYRVGVRFDACEPTLGAAIYNLETSSLNHHAFKPGQLMGWATLEPPGPQLSTDDPRLIEGLQLADVSRYGADPDIGLKLRKEQMRWHRTEFRAMPRPGQPATKASVTRDGRGNVSKVEQSGGRRMETPAEAAFQRGGTRAALGVSARLGVAVSNALANDPESLEAAEALNQFLADNLEESTEL